MQLTSIPIPTYSQFRMVLPERYQSSAHMPADRFEGCLADRVFALLEIFLV